MQNDEQHKIKLLDQLLQLAYGMSELGHVMLAIPIGYVDRLFLLDQENNEILDHVSQNRVTTWERLEKQLSKD